MPANLRPEVEIFRAGPQRFVLLDSRTGESFEFGSMERLILQCLEGAASLDEIRERYRRRHGDSIAEPQLRAFVAQMQARGLKIGRAHV